jgi:hypothetical protein
MPRHISTSLRGGDHRLPKREPAVVRRHCAMREDGEPGCLQPRYELAEEQAVLKYTARERYRFVLA